MFIPDYPIFSANNLTSSEKIVLLAIKFHIGQNKTSYVSQGTLSRDASLTRKTIMTASRSLVAKGWLKIEKRQRGTHVYSLQEERFKLKPSASKPAGSVEPRHIMNNNKCTDELTAEKSVSTDNNSHYTEECKTNSHKVVTTKTIGPNIDQKLKASAAEAAPFELSKKSLVSVGEIKSINDKMSTKELETLWREKIPEYFKDVQFIPIFTAKEIKMIKDITALVNPHNPNAILTFLIENWKGYTWYAKEKNGAYGIPHEPTLPFIVKNVGAAVNYYLQNKKHGYGKSEEELSEFKMNKLLLGGYGKK